MENLAFIHLAVGYEDPRPEPTLRSLKEMGLTVPNSAWLGLVSALLVSSILTTAHSAMALVTRGSTGSAVTAVQEALQNRGYNVSVDGVFGGQTLYAVTYFQRDHGLSADGVVGPATAKALGLSSSVYNPGSGSNSGGGGGGSPSGYVTVYASGLNVRSGPGLGYPVINGLGYGSVVATTGRRENGWVELYRGGWISAAYTNLGGATGGGGGGGSPSSGAVTVTAGIGVNIRSGPGTGYAVVGGLPYGARVTTYGSSNGWYRVSGGWISSSYVR